MAIAVSVLIADALQRLHLPEGWDGVGLFTGNTTGAAAMVAGRDTDAYLLQQVRQCLALLCSPSQYNCVLLSATVDQTVTLAAWGGAVNGLTLTPPIWHVQNVAYNGMGLQRIGAAVLALYCKDGETGTPVAFMASGAGASIVPLPVASGGATQATVRLSGYGLPALPDDVNDTVDLSAGGVSDEDARYLLVRYLCMAIGDVRQDDPALVASGMLAEEEFCQLVWSKYMNLPVQVREAVFRVMTSPPVRNPGTLANRKRAEA